MKHIEIKASIETLKAIKYIIEQKYKRGYDELYLPSTKKIDEDNIVVRTTRDYSVPYEDRNEGTLYEIIDLKKERLRLIAYAKAEKTSYIVKSLCKTQRDFIETGIWKYSHHKQQTIEYYAVSKNKIQKVLQTLKNE